MKMEYVVNVDDKIIITLNDGTSYQGKVKKKSCLTQTLSLTNVIQCPNNVEIHGIRNFEFREISKIELVETSVLNEEEALSSKLECLTLPTEKSSSMKIPVSEYNHILDLQKTFHLINNYGSNMYCALSALKKSEIIGVLVREASFGRRDRASVIATATDNNIFIFDLEVVGDRVLDMGLRDILNCKSIIKVLYDCRYVSDCLYHKHQTTLENVRDVEAEDIIMVHQERGCIRKHTRTFGYLIETYLGIPAEVVDESKLTESWKTRPLSMEHQNFLATFCSFLIPLHRTIQRTYLQRLADASNIYNKFIRELDMYEYVIQDCRLVSRHPIIDLVKFKTACRGTKTKAMKDSLVS